MAGGPTTSPIVYRSADEQGRTVTVTVNFNNATGDLTSVVITRDAGCGYTGLDVTRRADGARRAFTATGTSRTIGRTALVAADLANLTDLGGLRCERG